MAQASSAPHGTYLCSPRHGRTLASASSSAIRPRRPHKVLSAARVQRMSAPGTTIEPSFLALRRQTPEPTTPQRSSGRLVIDIPLLPKHLRQQLIQAPASSSPEPEPVPYSPPRRRTLASAVSSPNRPKRPHKVLSAAGVQRMSARQPSTDTSPAPPGTLSRASTQTLESSPEPAQQAPSPRKLNFVIDIPPLPKHLQQLVQAPASSSPEPVLPKPKRPRRDLSAARVQRMPARQAAADTSAAPPGTLFPAPTYYGGVCGI